MGIDTSASAFANVHFQFNGDSGYFDYFSFLISFFFFFVVVFVLFFLKNFLQTV